MASIDNPAIVSGPDIGRRDLFLYCRWADGAAFVFLMLNGEGTGPTNNIAIPSRASPEYAPA